MAAGKLDELRKEIDKIDKDIFGLILKRRDIASKIFETKELENLPLRDAEREKELLSGKKKLAIKSCLQEDDIEIIFKTLIKVCLEGAK